MKLQNAVIKIKNYIEKNKNKMKLKNKSFTIISNNCWGGLVYQKFGLKYTSPTVGLFFIGGDYVKFCERLEYYTSIDLKFIPFNQSKNYALISCDCEYPIGVLDDIEIYFMHYKSQLEAKEKWEKRCKRISYNNIIFKISQREGYTKEDIINFLNLNKKNKIAFAHDVIEGAIHVPTLKDLRGDEMPIIEKFVDFVDIINNIKTGK